MTNERELEFDEKSMFREYKRTKDKKIREKIISNYMYIAEIISKRFANRGIDYEDVFQVACLGLVLAVDRFDETKGSRFVSFATPTVTGEIKKYFRDKGCFIKIPRKLYEVFVKAEKMREGLATDNVSKSQIAKLLGLPEETVRKAYAAGDVAFIKSLEHEAYSEGGSMLYDTLGSDDKNFLIIENADFMNYCMDALSEKEREFVNLRYYEEETQKEIADRWGMSQMQVSRFEKGILNKLRENSHI